MLGMVNTIGGIVVLVFVFVMSIVLWNAGLMNGIRRYGEIGVRLAMGEPKGGIYRAMIFESVCLGIVGSVLGTAIGLAVSYWMQVTGLDFSSMMQKSTITISSVMHARVTTTSYYIGFLPGVFASVLGTLFAGIGIYKRQTSQLFKELET
jgi:putative ABC transport system permease protein